VTRARSASLSQTVRQTIVAHARAESPRECCGLLVGAGRRVDFAIPLSNTDSRPRTGFRVDPAEHIAVRRILRHVAPARAIVGVYHSHPSGAAVPSPSDIAEAHYPDWLHLIVGVKGRAIAVNGYRITRRRVLPVHVRWTDT